MPEPRPIFVRRIRVGGRRVAAVFVAIAVIGLGVVESYGSPDERLEPFAASESPIVDTGVFETLDREYSHSTSLLKPSLLSLIPQTDAIVPPSLPSPTAAGPSPSPETASEDAQASQTVESAAPASPSASAQPATGGGGLAVSAVSVDPRVGNDFILVSRSQLVSLPMEGPAWQQLKAVADASAGSPNLGDNAQENNVRVLAKALVFARTGDGTYRADVVSQLKQTIGTEGVDTLALGRNLAAYALAADYINLATADQQFDQAVFRPWLRSLLTLSLDGVSLTDTHERRANNWGTHAGASRAAVAAYLGDAGELARVATVFRGWLGDRSAYAGFSYGDLSWQADPSKPVGINPSGATIKGHDVGGVLPDDQRRTGDFTWPPPCGNYPHGAMDGALLTAEILARAGYPAYEWSDRALLRAASWLRTTGCPPSGDNVWQLPLLDARYGTSWWNGAAVRPGKNFGWTDWLYGR